MHPRATLALASCSLLLACRGAAKLLPVSERCDTPEVVSCLQDYARPQLRSRDVERLLGEGLPKCVSRDPKTLLRQSSCFPLEMGKDERGQSVALVFRCDDNCLGSGSVTAIYGQPKSLAQCCAEGGYAFPVFSAGGRYGGCGPPELLTVLEKQTGRRQENHLCAVASGQQR